MKLIQNLFIVSMLFSIIACSTTTTTKKKDAQNNKKNHAERERFFGRFER